MDQVHEHPEGRFDEGLGLNQDMCWVNAEQKLCSAPHSTMKMEGSL